MKRTLSVKTLSVKERVLYLINKYDSLPQGKQTFLDDYDLVLSPPSNTLCV